MEIGRVRERREKRDRQIKVGFDGTRKDLRRERQAPSHQRQDGREDGREPLFKLFDGVAVLLPFFLPDVLQTTKRQEKSKISFAVWFSNKFKSSPFSSDYSIALFLMSEMALAC